MSGELSDMAREVAELRKLRDRVRDWSDTADRLLILDGSDLSTALRRLLIELREVAL